MNQAPNAGRAAPVDVVALLPTQQLMRMANLPARDVEPGVECLLCGAELTGLRSDQRCPTCGGAIGRTLQGNFLKFSQPEHLRQLIKGFTLLLSGLILPIIVTVLSQVLALLEEARPSFAVGVLAGGLLCVSGMWLLTAPALNAIDAAWESKARKRIRILLVVSLAVPVIILIDGFLVDRAVGETVLRIALLMIGTVAVFGVRDSLLYLRKLALRIPSLPLATATTVAAWGLPICLGLAIALWYATSLTSPPSRAGEGAAGGVTCAAWVAVVGFATMAVVLIMQYRSQITDQATFAEHTWAHPSAGGTPSDEQDVEPIV